MKIKHDEYVRTINTVLAKETHTWTPGRLYLRNKEREFSIGNVRILKKYDNGKLINSENMINHEDTVRLLTPKEIDAYLKSSVALGLIHSAQAFEDELHDTISDTNGNIDITRYLKNQNSAQVTNQQNKKEEKTMSSKLATTVSSGLSTLKADAVDGAWRAAAKQTIKSAKVPLLTFLKGQKVPGMAVEFLTTQLDSENGEAALGLLLGTVMTYLPQFCADQKMNRLAKELRVFGMDCFISKIADIMLNPVRDQLAEIVKNVPFAMPGADEQA